MTPIWKLDTPVVRQPNDAPGGGGAQRIVHIDTNVILDLHRGNAKAAATLRRLLNDPNVSVRVSPQAYNELVTEPFPRTAAANRLMLSELGIQKSAAPVIGHRVDLDVGTQRKDGQNFISQPDQLVLAAARQENAELWTLDGGIKDNAKQLEKNLNVRIAKESFDTQHTKGKEDFRVARRLMGLEEVEISTAGSITRRGGGGGGPAGPSGPGTPPLAVPPGQPPLRPPGGKGARRAFRLKALPKLHLSMGRLWGRFGGAAAVTAAGAGLALLGSYIKSKVEERSIEADFVRHHETIQKLIAAKGDEILEVYGENPAGAVFGHVSFRLEYHIIYEPADRIQIMTYAGLTIDGVKIGRVALDTLGEMPRRQIGQLITVAHVRGVVSVPIPVAEMFEARDLAAARIDFIEKNLLVTTSADGGAALNEERNRLVEQLRETP